MAYSRISSDTTVDVNNSDVIQKYGVALYNKSNNTYKSSISPNDVSILFYKGSNSSVGTVSGTTYKNGEWSVAVSLNDVSTLKLAISYIGSNTASSDYSIKLKNSSGAISDYKLKLNLITSIGGYLVIKYEICSYIDDALCHYISIDNINTKILNNGTFKNILPIVPSTAGPYITCWTSGSNDVYLYHAMSNNTQGTPIARLYTDHMYSLHSLMELDTETVNKIKNTNPYKYIYGTYTTYTLIDNFESLLTIIYTDGTEFQDAYDKIFLCMIEK